MKHKIKFLEEELCRIIGMTEDICLDDFEEAIHSLRRKEKQNEK